MSITKKLIYCMLMVFGILGILDTLFLLDRTNVSMGVVLPGIIGVLLLAYILLKIVLLKGRPIIKSHFIKKIAIIIVAAFVIFFMLIEILIICNSKSSENISAEYLIIPGAGINGETVSLALKSRLDKGIEYLNLYPDSKVIVTGGRGFEEKITEAEAMKRYLVTHNIKPEKIIKEEKASSTMENFKFSKLLIDNLEGNSFNSKIKITIITSDFHMLRAKILARRNGFEPYGISCSTPLSVRYNSYMREFFALIKSYLFDR